MAPLKEIPAPNTPQPDEPTTPAPEQPARRRRIIQPVFSTRHVRAGRPFHLLALALSLSVCATTMTAQTDTTHTRNRMDKSTSVQNNGQNVQDQHGWTMFNDQMGKEYGLTDDQMRRLREVDARYASEYRALGTNPTTDPGYSDLTRRRNNDIRGIVSNDVYTRWEKRYGGMQDMNNDRNNGGQKHGTATPKTNSGTRQDNTDRPK